MNPLRREPVLFGAAITGTVDGGALLFHVPTATQAVIHGIVLAWVALVVRLLSTPTVRVDEKVEEAKYVGAVEHQATAAAGQALELAARARPLHARPPDMPPA